MGMALKSEFGDEAFQAWDTWSQRAASYSVKSAKTVWKSIKYGGRTTIASLFHVARSNGWIDSGEMHTPIPEEIRKAERQRKERAEQAAQKEARDHKRAAEAGEILLASAQIDEHPYLKSKQLPELKGFVLPEKTSVRHPDGYSILVGGSLFIPMRDCVTGVLTGAQMIKWHQVDEQFRKLFIPGMRAWGSAFRIGNKQAATTIFCEGYATGYSIMKAAHLLRLDVSAVVCFSAGNIANVATKLRGRRAIFADNDSQGVGEKFAKKTGLPYTMSDTVGNDANDDMDQHGIFCVAKKLNEIIRNL
jgi:putative DNA primase/helicase